MLFYASGIIFTVKMIPQIQSSKHDSESSILDCRSLIADPSLPITNSKFSIPNRPNPIIDPHSSTHCSIPNCRSSLVDPQSSIPNQRSNHLSGSEWDSYNSLGERLSTNIFLQYRLSSCLFLFKEAVQEKVKDILGIEVGLIILKHSNDRQHTSGQSLLQAITDNRMGVCVISAGISHYSLCIVI